VSEWGRDYDNIGVAHNRSVPGFQHSGLHGVLHDISEAGFDNMYIAAIHYIDDRLIDIDAPNALPAARDHRSGRQSDIPKPHYANLPGFSHIVLLSTQFNFSGLSWRT
jgi:hypothetical protein